ncbi:hypothetical protein GOODEAATRI_025922 [Goodea atripinnis]|uniref:Uncharacterized protein n=1 Tax=Goodea atripinnis TaxID=208336 RepID=A0ABV0Q132_9TELE
MSNCHSNMSFYSENCIGLLKRTSLPERCFSFCSRPDSVHSNGACVFYGGHMMSNPLIYIDGQNSRITAFYHTPASQADMSDEWNIQMVKPGYCLNILRYRFCTLTSRMLLKKSNLLKSGNHPTDVCVCWVLSG